jgi:Invasion associated locus B (IalB) protein
MRSPVPSLLRFAAPLVSAACLATSGPAFAQHKGHAHAAPARRPAASTSAAPKAIGKFGDWEAATHAESGETVCYAFTRATSSTPALPGRGDVVMTVTQRPGLRDVVAISAGFAYAPGADVTVQADQASFPFYTAQRSAFARDGHAVVAAFQKSGKAVAKSPAPRNAEVTDSFSLRGFGPAYAAINKACPPQGAAPAGKAK